MLDFILHFWAAKYFSRRQKLFPWYESEDSVCSHLLWKTVLISQCASWNILQPCQSCLPCTLELRIKCICCHHSWRHLKPLKARWRDLKHSWDYHQEHLDAHSELLAGLRVQCFQPPHEHKPSILDGVTNTHQQHHQNCHPSSQGCLLVSLYLWKIHFLQGSQRYVIPLQWIRQHAAYNDAVIMLFHKNLDSPRCNM